MGAAPTRPGRAAKGATPQQSVWHTTQSMPRSLGGPGRPDCASGMGAPDAKHTNAVAIFSGPARQPSASDAAKGALVSTAATSSSARARRLAAPTRRMAEKDGVIF